MANVYHPIPQPVTGFTRMHFRIIKGKDKKVFKIPAANESEFSAMFASAAKNDDSVLITVVGDDGILGIGYVIDVQKHKIGDGDARSFNFAGEGWRKFISENHVEINDGADFLERDGGFFVRTVHTGNKRLVPQRRYDLLVQAAATEAAVAAAAAEAAVAAAAEEAVAEEEAAVEEEAAADQGLAIVPFRSEAGLNSVIRVPEDQTNEDLSITESLSQPPVIKETESELQALLREKEVFLEKISSLEKELEEFRSLRDYCDDPTQKKMKDMAEQWNQKIQDDDLKEARKVLINGLFTVLKETPLGEIGVKYFVEIEEEVFFTECKKKYAEDEAIIKAKEAFTQWQANLIDPAWHPFKTVSPIGRPLKVINEEDEKLMKLKEEWGISVYNTVETALWEIDKDKLGRCVILDLWNYKERRKATMKEGVEGIFRNLLTLKRKRDS